MVLTRSFKDTLAERTRRDPSFRRAVLAEAMNALMEGDVETGTSVLRDYANATTVLPPSRQPSARRPRA